jgi:hypothetical protein
VIVGAIVLVVAATATTCVIREPIEKVRLVATIIPLEDIPANKLLDPLIEEGLFEEIFVPSDMVEGTVTDIRDLYGLKTVTPILAHELISRSMLTARDYPDQGHVPRR